MEALLLYSKHSGKRSPVKKLDFILSELSGSFSSIEARCFSAKEETAAFVKEKGSEYDVIIVAGGDGTFNNVINSLMDLPKKPILGYLNYGTIGDVGKNFGVTRNLKKSLEIIKRGRTEDFDVGLLECDDRKSYFSYMAAEGAYSDISYVAKRHEKKRFGAMAYYKLAFKEAFHKHEVDYEIIANGHRYTGVTPFILLLNGIYVGGFKVNRKGAINDGKLDLFLAKPSLFNGLCSYFFRAGITTISGDSFDITFKNSGIWCVDGEESLEGNVKASLIHNALKIFSSK